MGHSPLATATLSKNANTLTTLAAYGILTAYEPGAVWQAYGRLCLLAEQRTRARIEVISHFREGGIASDCEP
jgi:hypothetical protein